MLYKNKYSHITKNPKNLFYIDFIRLKNILLAHKIKIKL